MPLENKALRDHRRAFRLPNKLRFPALPRRAQALILILAVGRCAHFFYVGSIWVFFLVYSFSWGCGGGLNHWATFSASPPLFFFLVSVSLVNFRRQNHLPFEAKGRMCQPYQLYVALSNGVVDCPSQQTNSTLKCLILKPGQVSAVHGQWLIEKRSIFHLDLLSWNWPQKET